MPQTKQRRQQYYNEVTKPQRTRDSYRRLRAPRQQVYYQSQKARVFAILGGECVVCGFNDPRALQVDHIHGNGHAERIKLTSRGIYAKILRMDNPQSEYQLLCANHNWIKRSENREVRWSWLYEKTQENTHSGND